MIINQSITRSRQHYLKLTLPETYRNLSGRGIAHDYTMGYADLPGFRAGTSRSFLFYDLLSETATNLRVHPFVYMDGTFHDYMKLSPDQSVEVVEELINNIKSVGGKFICIWHNHSVSDSNEWAGWRKLFEYTLQMTYED